MLCPSCGGEELKLSQEGGDGEEILEGEIACKTCGKTYPIVRGIPRMLPEAAKYFGEGGGDSSGDPEGAEDLRLTVENYSAYQGKAYAPLADRLDNRKILGARTGLDVTNDFKGKVCLDAGCGVGRFCRTMASEGAELVVGFDAGYAVDEARAISGDYENIEWVQADILRPPFRASSFDRVISIGVLNLTARPDSGFDLLSKLVRSAGTFSIYVHHCGYTPWNKIHSIKAALGHLYDIVVKERFRRWVARRPDNFRHKICVLLWKYFCLLEGLKKKGGLSRRFGFLVERLGPAHSRKKLESAESNITRNFDSYSTPFQHSNELGEIIDWFERGGRFGKILIAPFRISVTGWNEDRDSTQPMMIEYFPERSIDDVEAIGVEGEES